MRLFRRNSIDYLIVGLGNPGAKYETTRHNAGFLFIDRLATRFGFKINRLKHYSLSSTESFSNFKVAFLKPQTYMNKSGLAVADALRFYKLTPENLIVVYDDISLPTGSMRIRKKGSSGGQKGLESIIEHIGTDSFLRIRIGVGSPTQNIHPDSKQGVAEYVLGDISKTELPLINDVIDDAIDAVEMIVSNKVEEAMNKYNKRGIGEK